MLHTRKCVFCFCAMIALAMALANVAMADSSSIYGIHFWGTGASGIMNSHQGYDVETTWVQNKTDWSDIRSKVQSAVNDGFTPIVRFNWAGGYTVPANNDWTSRATFATQCKAGVAALGDLCHIWVIGNEMNLSGEGGIPASWYLYCFNGYDSNNCYTQIHNQQSTAVVCLGPVCPNSPDTNATGPYDNTLEKWKNYWYYIVNNTGMNVDGYVVHAYGGRQGGQPGNSGYDPDARDDLNLPYGATNDNIDVCWGFNSFRYQVNEINTKMGDLNLPIFITETNTDLTAVPSTSYQTGWMQTAYESIDTWNKMHYNKIRTLCWFVYDPAGSWSNFSLETGTGNCNQAKNDYSSMTSTAASNTADTPDAYVYSINTGSTNQNSSDSTQIVPSSYVGRWMGWQGGSNNFGSGGPLGTSNYWMVYQLRHFYASSDGTYGFQTTSTGGSWLWVDGKQVVCNYGVSQNPYTMSATTTLTAGYHSVMVQFFQWNNGNCTIAYQYQPPSQGWQTIPDGHPKKGNATVYHLNAGGSSLNSSDMTQIVAGSYVGSFGWNGVEKIFGVSQGPLGQTTDWIIQQGGVFWAPSSGTYTFRTGSCDGSWLWIDGKVVVNNYGCGPLTWASGTKSLVAGWHMIWYKGFYHNTNSSATQCAEEEPSGTTELDPLAIY